MKFPGYLQAGHARLGQSSIAIFIKYFCEIFILIRIAYQLRRLLFDKLLVASLLQPCVLWVWQFHFSSTPSPSSSSSSGSGCAWALPSP